MIDLTRIRSALRLPADPGDTGVAISSIAYDSRAVTSGALFVAIPGFHVDGHDYLDAVVRSGASAIVVRRDRASSFVNLPIPKLVVEDTRPALSAAAAEFYGHPGRSMRVIGVTGTDGKTTTTYMISAVLEAAGQQTGLMGTVQFKVGPAWRENDTRQTTPEALEVQALLAEMRDAGVTHAVVESSSHGLELHKLDDCDYDVAVVTNVGADHLELHGTPAAYLAAKGRLFELLGRDGGRGPRTAIVNADDASAAHMRSRSRASVISYGIDSPADVRAVDLHLDESGSRFRLESPSGGVMVHVAMPGRFNVSNALAAAAVGLAEGVTPEVIARGIGALRGVPGRMERVDLGQPFAVVVDYAHTGPALEKVLRALRPVTRGRLIVVFGCAGGRSPERRAAMGEVAARHADVSVLANEDPHEEDPAAILADIAAALTAAGRREGTDFHRIEDRRAAIRRALELAGPDDLILLAGKGHEQSIVVGRTKTPWDERQVAREELAALGFGAESR